MLRSGYLFGFGSWSGFEPGSMAEMGFTAETIRILEKENIIIPIHLLLLTPEEVDHLIKPTGDTRRISNYIQPVAPSVPEIKSILKVSMDAANIQKTSTTPPPPVKFVPLLPASPAYSCPQFAAGSTRPANVCLHANTATIAINAAKTTTTCRTAPNIDRADCPQNLFLPQPLLYQCATLINPDPS